MQRWLLLSKSPPKAPSDASRAAALEGRRKTTSGPVSADQLNQEPFECFLVARSYARWRPSLLVTLKLSSSAVHTAVHTAVYLRYPLGAGSLLSDPER